MNINCVIECPNRVVEKTVRRALGGHGASPVGDVREAPTTERSFLAGETESVFAITDWETRISFIRDLEMLTTQFDISTKVLYLYI